MRWNRKFPSMKDCAFTHASRELWERKKVYNGRRLLATFGKDVAMTR
jgi:hypothetical protein